VDERRRRGEALQLMNSVIRDFEARLYAELSSLRGFERVRAAYLTVFRNMNPHGSRVTDIARRAGLTKQAIGLLVKDMVAADLVEVVPDPSDARARLVRIPKGSWSRHEQVGHIVANIFHDLERRIGADRWATLTELLRALVDPPTRSRAIRRARPAGRGRAP
jgi:DNA-binding MarR family transcriptional regulator